MAWELDNKRSIYGQLVEVILRRIVTGVYPAGSKLESVRDLAQEAGVNPNTMQRALQELENTGIINTQRTSGKYVTEDKDMIDGIKERLAEDLIQKLLQDMKDLGFDRSDVEKMLKKDSEEGQK